MPILIKLLKVCCFDFNVEERLPLLTRSVLTPQKNQTAEQVERLRARAITRPIVPSLLRDRLLSLQHAVDYIARKNAWPVPTGIQMLARSLERLPVASEAQLLEILVQAKTIIEERIKLSYLTRDPVTYLFYQRIFYDWLEPLSIAVKEGQLNSQLVRLNGHWLSQCRATQDALVKLHGFLFEIRCVAQSTTFQKVGKRFIVFGEKQPEGLARIEHYLQRLPEQLSRDQQILLLKQFMQLRRLFTEKYASKNRLFRHSRVNLFYQTQHILIQVIFHALSGIDQHLLLAIDLDDNTPLTRDFLPAPLSLLANPEKLTKILTTVEQYQAKNDVYRTDYFSSVENDPVSAVNLGSALQSSAANLSRAFSAN